MSVLDVLLSVFILNFILLLFQNVKPSIMQKIAFIIPPTVELLDLAGPVQVFT